MAKERKPKKVNKDNKKPLNMSFADVIKASAKDAKSRYEVKPRTDSK